MSSLAMMAKMLGGKTPSESSLVKAVTMEAQDKSTGTTQPDKNSDKDIQARIDAALKACTERLAANQSTENRSTPVPGCSTKAAEKLKELGMGTRPTTPTPRNP